VRPVESGNDGIPREDAGVGELLSEERRAAILRRVINENTREFRATVLERQDFQATLVRRTPPPNHVLHVSVESVLILVACLYLLVGRAGGGLPIQFLALGMPLGYGLFWILLAATAGEELEVFSVDGRGSVTSVRTGRAVETRENIIRVAIPTLIAAVSGSMALVLIHDLVFQPVPNCTRAAVFDSDLCVMLPGLLDSKVGGFTRGEYRGLLENLRLLALIFSTLFLLPSIWFLRRMLTGRRVFDIRPVDQRIGDPPAATSFPGTDGKLMAMVVAVLCVALTCTIVVPMIENGSGGQTTAGVQPTAGGRPSGSGGICAIFGSPYLCTDGGTAQVTIDGTTTTVSPGGCFDDGNGLMDARYGDMKNFVGDHVFVTAGRDGTYTPVGSGSVGGRQFNLGTDATGVIRDDNRGTVVATDSLGGYGTITIVFSCG
jgi:hypothetical protein